MSEMGPARTVDRAGPPAPPARFVAVIADGNERWARRRGLTGKAAHDVAADTLKARLADARRLGIEELTVYAFSTENWLRPAAEIDSLMEMFCRRIAIEAPALHEDGIRMRFVGRRDGLAVPLLEQIEMAHRLTEDNHDLTLFIAFNYGGRAEIVHAAKGFDGDSEEDFQRRLYAPEMHEPEVIIRTGAERRLSNFLLWQAAYAELVFRDELWPDFTCEAFEAALLEFGDRKRRFGGR